MQQLLEMDTEFQHVVSVDWCVLSESSEGPSSGFDPSLCPHRISPWYLGCISLFPWLIVFFFSYESFSSMHFQFLETFSAWPLSMCWFPERAPHFLFNRLCKILVLIQLWMGTMCCLDFIFCHQFTSGQWILTDDIHTTSQTPRRQSTCSDGLRTSSTIMATCNL